MTRFPFIVGSLAVAAAMGVGFVALAPLARAQVSPSFAVSPEKFELSFSRGQVWEDAIRIANRSDVPMPVHLRLVRWDARDEVGGIDFLSTPEDASFDITQWLTLGKNDFILEAGESERVSLRITVPANAEPGGKYGAIIIEPTLPEFYFTPGAARVLPQMSVLFLVDIPLVGLEGPIAPAVAVEQLEVEGRSPVLSAVASRFASLFRAPLRAFAVESPVTVEVLSRTASEFVLRVRNDGITHVRPSGTATVHNFYGREVAQADLPSTTILPGKVRQVPVALDTGDTRFLPEFVERQLAFGRYRAAVVLEGVGEEPILASLSYWIFPWSGILLALVVLGPLIFFGYRIRYRIISASRILFRIKSNHNNLNNY